MMMMMPLGRRPGGGGGRAARARSRRPASGAQAHCALPAGPAEAGARHPPPPPPMGKCACVRPLHRGGGGWGGGSRPRLRCARALLRGPGGLRGGWGACAEGGGGLGWWSVSVCLSVRPSVLSLSLSSGAPSYLSRQPWGSCLRLGWYSWRLFFGGGGTVGEG